MATFADIKTQIEQELAESENSDLSVEIDRAVNAAIKHYESEDLWFLQTTGTQSTVAGTYLYTMPADLVRIGEITLTVNSYTYPLWQRTWPWLQKMLLDTSNYRGEPDAYAVWGSQVGLYPVPDAVYTLTFWYNRRFPELVNGTDSNAWLEHAYGLVRARATWDLLEHTIQDAEFANRMKAIELDELRNLRGDHVAIQGHTRLTPTCW